jgi:sortase A
VNSRAAGAVLDGTNTDVDERLSVVDEPAAKPNPGRSRPVPVWTVARRGALTLGIVVLTFVGFAIWFSGLAHARSQVGLQRRFRAELSAAHAPIGGVIATGAPVAIIDISRIGVHEVVVEGTRSGQLREGPGHLVGSSLPGQPGNTVIASRRTMYGAPFRHLAALHTGDDIHLTTGDGNATYRVTGIARVRAEDGSVFADHGDNRLTLFTADSTIDPSRRLVVTARLAGNAFAAQPLRRALDPEGLGLTGDRNAIASVLVWLELLVALSALAVFALTRWSRVATWTVFAPGIAVVAWLFFENAVRLLPATL